MLKSYQLNAIPTSKYPNSDRKHLMITSITSNTDWPSSVSISNGKTKIITGLPSKFQQKPYRYFSNSPDIGLISLRSYYSNHIRDIPPSRAKYSYKKDTDNSLEPEEEETSISNMSNELLIVKQSKLSMIETYSDKKKHLRNMYMSFSKAPLKQKKLKQLIFDKVSLKEAAKDRDWLVVAKPKIIQSLATSICKSNGIDISIPAAYTTYKYYIGPGNNSKLIKQCISQRWWWTKTSSSEILVANFVWTQWREQSFLDKLQSLCKNQHKKQDIVPFSIKNETIYKFQEQSGVSRRKAVDISVLGYDKITKSNSFTYMDVKNTTNAQTIQLHNKIDYNFLLSNKKGLFYNLKQYYKALGVNAFNYIPMTFHIKNDSDEEFLEFSEYFYKNNPNEGCIWILKPGENTNRGNGILIFNSIDDIKNEIKNKSVAGPGTHTFILQKYIEKPFLINQRKFDIRCYALITSINGIIQCYYYEEGYIRTSSKKYCTSNINNMFIHLTNDAIQKKSENYGKFEFGNKLMYSEFQKYLKTNFSEKKVDFWADIIPKIKDMIKDTVQSVFLKLDPYKRAHSFEIFGYDFMLDEELKPWLIEVNTNPCLELSCSHLARLIPAMIDNALKIALDPLFPEPQSGVRKPMPLSENKFELIFHSYTDGISLIKQLMQKNTLNLIQEINPVLLELNNQTDEQHTDSEDEIN
jgi:Tubulin-tyrosine ligase family